jgi:hypothetical protein
MKIPIPRSTGGGVRLLRRVVSRFGAILLAGLLPIVLQAADTVSPLELQKRAEVTFINRPVLFEPNRGQFPARFGFGSRTNGQAVLVGASGATVAARPAKDERASSITMKLIGGRADAPPVTGDAVQTVTNYLTGNDPSKLIVGVPNYERVRYSGVYEGIDVVFHSSQEQLEYDFVVAPGANPSRIRMRFDGTARIEGLTEGDLLLHTSHGTIRHRKPVAYQLRDGKRVEIAARYRIAGKRDVVFELGTYDRNAELIIDPIVVFSTFFGGLGENKAHDMALDPSGNIYIAGQTTGSPALATPGAFQSTNADGAAQDGLSVLTEISDGFIAKINANGTAVMYTTYLGGWGHDIIRSIAVDGLGNAVVGGQTSSADFPTTAGTVQPSLSGGFQTRPSKNIYHGFVTRLNSSGSGLLFSTFLGGNSLYANDAVWGVASDNVGNVWAVGETQSTDFPTTPGAYQTQIKTAWIYRQDGFVTKLSPAGALVYSTFLGSGMLFGIGTAEDRSESVVVDSTGHAYVLSYAGNFDFPHTANIASGDYYLTKLSPDGSQLVYSAEVGGRRRFSFISDRSADVAIDSQGAAYVVGSITGPDSFTSTPNAYQTDNACAAAYLLKISPSGTTADYATVIHGTGTCPSSHPPNTLGFAVAVDSNGNMYVAGATEDKSFQALNAVQPTVQPNFFESYDGFVMKFNGAGQLQFSTPFGGSEDDQIYSLALYGLQPIISGYTQSRDFWNVGGLNTRNDEFAGDIFVSKLDLVNNPPQLPYIAGVTPNMEPIPGLDELFVRGYGFQDDAVVTVDGGQSGYSPDFVDGSSYAVIPTNRPPGTYELKLTNPGGAEAKFSPVRYMAAPESCNNRTPGTGPMAGGTHVKITGSGYQAGARVTVGGAPATNVVVSGTTQIDFDTPPAKEPTPYSTIVITNPNGMSAGCYQFAYTLPASVKTPTLTQVSTSTVSSKGGPGLRVQGSNLTYASVFLRPVGFTQGGHVSEPRLINDGLVELQVSTNLLGTFDVVARGPDGAQAVLPGAVTILAEDGITPNQGPLAGGTVVTIKGGPFMAGANVFFDRAPATNVQLIDANTLQVTAPPPELGMDLDPHSIDVHNTDGRLFIYRDVYQYTRDTGEMTITAITPNHGSANGGDTVTIDGSGFTAAGSVSFGGMLVPNADRTFVNGNSIVVKTPPHVKGLVDVTVTAQPPSSGIYTKTVIDGFTYDPAPPVIQSITPNRGLPAGGTAVTITGSSFEPGATVTIGGAALVNQQMVSPGAITGTTPAHALGAVDVVVTNPDTQTFTLAGGFTYAYPVLTLTPANPAVSRGTSLTMTVTTNMPQPGNTIVTLQTSSGLITAPASVTIPANASTATFDISAGPTSGTVNLTATLPAALGSGFAQVTVVIPDSATITGFTPAFGPGGTSVTINGNRFSGASGVTFGGVNASSFTVINDTQMTAVAPAAGITGVICITTPGPLTGCSTDSFGFPPRITGFTPSSGAPGTSITVNGANLENASQVAFNGDTAIPTTTSPTSLTVTVPNNAITGPITVTTSFGTGTSGSPFGVPPAILSFDPSRGGPGTVVTITGNRFTGATAVTFNGTSAASFAVTTDGTMTATAPNTVTTGPISVTTPGGTTTTAGPFTAVATASVTSLNPNKGTPGTSVTITGSNFTGATAVAFNGAGASFTVQSDTTIIATVPPGATNGPISITTPEGTGTSILLFYLPPVLSSFAPNAGSVGGSVTIQGNNFNGATGVKFNNSVATFVVNAQEKITATVPAGATTGALTVITPYGSVSSTFAFTVLESSTPTMLATATSATTVFVTWSGDPTHTYEVRRIARKTDNFGSGILGRVTGNAYTDTTAQPGVTYLYGILDVSTGQFSNNDFATTIMFADDPLVIGTVVKSVHMTSLRAAVNAMRVAAALPVRSWTDPTPVVIRAVHMNELRAALTEAYLSLARYPAFDDDPVPVGMIIRKVHVTELREAVK